MKTKDGLPSIASPASDCGSPSSPGASASSSKWKKHRSTTMAFGLSTFGCFVALSLVLLSVLYRADLMSQHLLFQTQASAQLSGFRSRYLLLETQAAAAAAGLEALPLHHWNRSSVVPILLGHAIDAQAPNRRSTPGRPMMLMERVDGSPEHRLKGLAADLGVSLEALHCQEMVSKNASAMEDMALEEYAAQLSTAEFQGAHAAQFEDYALHPLEYDRKHYFLSTYSSTMQAPGLSDSSILDSTCVDMYSHHGTRVNVAHMWRSDAPVSLPLVYRTDLQDTVLPVLHPIMDRSDAGRRLLGYTVGYMAADYELEVMKETYSTLGWAIEDACSGDKFAANPQPHGDSLDVVALVVHRVLESINALPDPRLHLGRETVFDDLVLGDAGAAPASCRDGYGNVSPFSFVRAVYDPYAFEIDAEASLGGRRYAFNVWATPQFFAESTRFNMTVLLTLFIAMSALLSVAASSIMWQVSVQVDARAMAAASQRRADRAWAEVQAHERVIGYIHHEVKNPLNVVVGTIDLIDDVLAAAIRARHRRMRSRVQRANGSESKGSDMTGATGSVDSRLQQSPAMSSAATSMMSVRAAMSDRTLRQLRGDIRILREAAQQVERQVEDMLDFTRLRRGEMDVMMEPTHISRLLRDLVRDHRHMTKVPMVAKIEEVRGLHVITDSVRVRQLIANGLSNACRHTKDGSITLRAHFVPDEEGRAMLQHVRDKYEWTDDIISASAAKEAVGSGDFKHATVAKVPAELRRQLEEEGILKEDKEEVILEVEVKDTGPGLKGLDPRRLFRPFAYFQSSLEEEEELPPGSAGSPDPLSAPRTTLHSSGLGLPIANTLARCLGGACDLEDTGAGCRFRVLLPVIVLEEDDDYGSTSSDEAPVVYSSDAMPTSTIAPLTLDAVPVAHSAVEIDAQVVTACEPMTAVTTPVPVVCTPVAMPAVTTVANAETAGSGPMALAMPSMSEQQEDSSVSGLGGLDMPPPPEASASATSESSPSDAQPNESPEVSSRRPSAASSVSSIASAEGSAFSTTSKEHRSQASVSTTGHSSSSSSRRRRRNKNPEATSLIIMPNVEPMEIEAPGLEGVALRMPAVEKDVSGIMLPKSDPLQVTGSAAGDSPPMFSPASDEMQLHMPRPAGPGPTDSVGVPTSAGPAAPPFMVSAPMASSLEMPQAVSVPPAGDANPLGMPPVQHGTHSVSVPPGRIESMAMPPAAPSTDRERAQQSNGSGAEGAAVSSPQQGREADAVDRKPSIDTESVGTDSQTTSSISSEDVFPANGDMPSASPVSDAEVDPSLASFSSYRPSFNARMPGSQRIGRVRRPHVDGEEDDFPSYSMHYRKPIDAYNPTSPVDYGSEDRFETRFLRREFARGRGYGGGPRRRLSNSGSMEGFSSSTSSSKDDASRSESPLSSTNATEESGRHSVSSSRGGGGGGSSNSGSVRIMGLLAGQAEALEEQMSRKAILVVDDESSNVRLARRMLARLGWGAVGISSGNFRALVEVALRAAGQLAEEKEGDKPRSGSSPMSMSSRSTGSSTSLPVDEERLAMKIKGAGSSPPVRGGFRAVFLDIRLGLKYNGVDIMQRLRHRLLGVPVFAMTASTRRSEVEDYKASGFSGLLGKPVSMPKLQGLLEAVEHGKTFW